MSHPSKVKGAAFERDVASYLAANGHPHAERAYGAGRADDRGDIAGVPGFVIQCRNTKSIDLAGALHDANDQRINNRSPYCCAVIKRRQRPVRDSYVVMDLATFAALTRDALPLNASGQEK